MLYLVIRRVKARVTFIQRVKARLIPRSVLRRVLFIFASTPVGSNNLTCESSVGSSSVLLVGSLGGSVGWFVG
jgi:hypothetical protein